MRTLDQLEKDTLEWSRQRGITINGKLPTQTLKLVSEVGELCDNIAKGKDIRDDIGDCLVVLTNIAKLEGLTLQVCWEHAYADIKDRKGFLTSNGNFIKDTDPSYDQLLHEFQVEQGGLCKPSPTAVNFQQMAPGSDIFKVGFSDGTIHNLELSADFRYTHPQGIIGLTLEYIEAYNV